MTTTQLCSPKPVRSLLAAALLGVVTLAVLSLMAVAAPTAHADSVDNNFVNALNSRGITFASPQSAIVAAHQVCDELDSGRASSDVANDVMQQSSLDGYHAGFFVGVSIAAFCPASTTAIATSGSTRLRDMIVKLLYYYADVDRESSARHWASAAA